MMWVGVPELRIEYLIDVNWQKIILPELIKDVIGKDKKNSA